MICSLTNQVHAAEGRVSCPAGRGFANTGRMRRSEVVRVSPSAGLGFVTKQSQVRFSKGTADK